jgi:tyrocidine synthetase-3
MGLFVNLLPIRCRFQPDQSFLELATTLKETTFACYEHQLYPFDFVVDDLGITGNHNRSPLFDVLVQMQEKQGSSHFEMTNESAVDADSFELVTSTIKYVLTFIFFFSAPVATITIEYNTDLFKSATAARFLDKLEQIISITCRDPSISVSELSKRIRTPEITGLVRNNQFINETLSDDF